MPVKPIPQGMTTVTPHLSIAGADKAIEFYEKAFGAQKLEVAMDPSGKKIWHAAIRIGDAVLFINDTSPEMGVGQSQSSMWLYVLDTDASFKRAVDAGAKGTMPPADMFWGDRMAQVVDPFGQRWTIATHIKDMTKEEMQQAQDAFIAQMKK
ncbi:MAG: VOC family protein [Polyangiaceae bacterium]|nr:VOC family protein [Polyangiaceae bacterium]